MQDYQYKQFLRESRDKVAEWIADARVKGLFAGDMNQLENDWKAYKAVWDTEDKRRDEYLKTPVGRRHTQKMQQWEGKYHAYEEREKKHGVVLYEDRLADKHPGPPPKDDDYKPEKLGNPLEKFDIPIKPESLSMNDYRVLLGALHDGFTWYEKDKSEYICPDLRKSDTIVGQLYWQRMMKNSEYQPLIGEALRYVEKDIQGRESQG